MPANNPPRFVPTLTETAANRGPDTTILEDSSYAEKREVPDSMLDLDLSDLDGPVSRVSSISPLGEYQSAHTTHPLAASQPPVTSKPAVARPIAPPPSVPVRPAAAAPAPTSAPAQPVTLQSLLPRDWQAQMQQIVQQAVRQELQQQMPFLLLQWSKQIEEKVTPQIQQQLVKTMQSW